MPRRRLIPEFQSLMRPIVSFHRDGDDRRRRDLVEHLAAEFNLTSEERAELLPSGSQRRFDNRIAWALTHLTHAGLLTRPARGVTRITERGEKVLAEELERIDLGLLNRYEEYRKFRSPSDGDSSIDDVPTARDSDTPPEEAMEAAAAELRDTLAADLREKLVTASPDFFEQVVVDLLIAMGYGGSKREAGERLGQSGDMGIDGVIREDSLGLDAIYLQAKRWAPNSTVGRPDIQAFVGALHGARANKGVFLTTAKFSREASDYAASVSPRVVLIDGHELTRLMIDHGVGVLDRTAYVVKRLDEEYFLEGDV
jgi:restriction system protein